MHAFPHPILPKVLTKYYCLKWCALSMDFEQIRKIFTGYILFNLKIILEVKWFGMPFMITLNSNTLPISFK